MNACNLRDAINADKPVELPKLPREFGQAGVFGRVTQRSSAEPRIAIHIINNRSTVPTLLQLRDHINTDPPSIAAMITDRWYTIAQCSSRRSPRFIRGVVARVEAKRRLLGCQQYSLRRRHHPK